MDNCIFCQIANKKIPAKVHYEDDDFIAYEDIKPKALIHLLVIPKQHAGAMSTLMDDDFLMMGNLLKVAKHIAEKERISRTGYRIVINSGKDSGMEVDHLHLHLLGGSQLNDIN